MSHRAPFPPSPGLPPTLYSGMSSLQISQAGPGSIAGTYSHLYTSQSQKALLKGPKTARHQNRKSEHPSASAPWKDLRQAAAASSGHKRTVKDDAFHRNIQLIWSPFPSDTRPTPHKERDVMLRAATDHILETRAAGDRMYEEKCGAADRRLAALETAAEQRRIAQYDEEGRRRRDRERFTLWCIETAPDEEMRQFYQKNLDKYREWDREDAQQLRPA